MRTPERKFSAFSWEFHPADADGGGRSMQGHPQGARRGPMAKVRVYEIAREMGVENKDLVNRIRTLGITVTNHMSSLDPDDADRIKRTLEKERQENTVERRVSGTVIRRRSKRQRTVAPTAPEAVEAATEEVAPETAEVTAEATPVSVPEPAPVAEAEAEVQPEAPAVSPEVDETPVEVAEPEPPPPAEEPEPPAETPVAVDTEPEVPAESEVAAEVAVADP